MSGRKWIVVLGASVLVATAAYGQAGQPVVTLEEAIRRAEVVQPRMAQAHQAIITAEQRIRSTTGAFLPNLTGSTSTSSSFSEGVSRIDPSTGLLVDGNTVTNNWNGGLNASLDLFTGFRRFADRKAANSQRDAAEASLVDARFQQRLQTTNQFYDVLAAKQLLQVREASVRRAEEQLNVAVNRFRAGAATQSDSLRSVVNLGQARLQMITAQATLATAEANLGRLIGMEGRVAAVDDAELYRPIGALDTLGLRSEALTKAPSVQTAEYNARAAQAQLGVSKAAYFPSLTLSGSNTWSANNRNDYQRFMQRQVSLNFSWQLFNRFGREVAVQNQLAAIDVAESNRDEARRLVIANLTTRLAELESAALRIQITEASVAAAQEDLRVQQERYRVGLATIVDLLTTQEALSQAEVDMVNARFDYLRAKAQIEALIGRSL